MTKERPRAYEENSRKEAIAIKGEVRLKTSLLAQLERKGADIEYFQDLVDRYLMLWKTAKGLEADIKERGVTCIEFNARGEKLVKPNPSIKEHKALVDQMLRLLSQLGLTTENVIRDGEDDRL